MKTNLSLDFKSVQYLPSLRSVVNNAVKSRKLDEDFLQRVEYYAIYDFQEACDAGDMTEEQAVKRFLRILEDFERRNYQRDIRRLDNLRLSEKEKHKSFVYHTNVLVEAARVIKAKAAAEKPDRMKRVGGYSHAFHALQGTRQYYGSEEHAIALDLNYAGATRFDIEPVLSLIKEHLDSILTDEDELVFNQEFIEHLRSYLQKHLPIAPYKRPACLWNIDDTGRHYYK